MPFLGDMLVAWSIPLTVPHENSVTFSRSPGAAGAANAAASRNQLEAALAPWDFFRGEERWEKWGTCYDPYKVGPY